MAQISVADKEVTVKIVYYGPGMSGKTTNLLYIHQRIMSKNLTDMVSIATEGDRTLYFDFLPLETDIIPGFKAKFQLYTVPGQVQYNATRKLVLQGADGVVFVADSQWSRQKDNVDSFTNLKENLLEEGVKLSDIPYILEYNKRDLADAARPEYMEYLLNREEFKVPSFEAVATEGKGVFEVLNYITRMVVAKILKDIKK
ncbi:MAG TPA: gliding-motility protein MglA [candidate division Zixibacteria bacterium]|nr:gliding-motility protein MglA [candidate division Zixibacteria bacterium]